MIERRLLPMTHINRILLVLVFIFSPMVQGKDHVFLVGGGDGPLNSQVQIEMNAVWIEEMLRKQGHEMRVFFTDGQVQNPDVVTHKSPAKNQATPLEPLTRILGEYGNNYLSFRNHQLPNVEASTEASGLTAMLKKAFAAMPSGDRVFFIYQGHGSWEADSRNNALKLWNHTRLSAKEFEGLLGTLDPGVQFRFFFPQCYSGAFLSLADARSLAHNDSAQAKQCGFTAVSANEMSEGCTVSIKVGDYRDYSTYFFAALDGKTRLGELVTRSADEDGDGKVSLHEAHLYSLDNAYSTDISRSTSEDFLEKWQPWYLKWKANMSTIPDNVFAVRVRRIAANNGYAEEGQELIKTLFRKRAQYIKETAALRAKQEALQSRSASLREILKSRLLKRWPQASLQYTSAFKSFMDNKIDAVLEWAGTQTDYYELVTVQDKSAALKKEALDLDRKNTQISKIFRMIRLSRILEQLKVYGSSEERAAYQSLLACEDNPL
jgi:hypothetical protein